MPNCGKCIECLRKKKFGGDGSSKQACLLRRCTDLRRNSSGGTNMMTRPKSTLSSTTTPRRASFTNSNSNSNSNSNDDGPRLSTASTSAAAARQEQQEPPFYKRPLSLLTEPPFPKRPRVALSASKTHMYGLPIPSVPPLVGVCAECGLGGQDDPEVVLLCDGPNCGREYHLNCCIPPLTEVPEDSFYCVDCSTTGTTHLLEQYLEEHYERKQEYISVAANYTFAHEYVDKLLQQDVREEGQQTSTTADSKNRIPVSELHQVHKNPEEKMIGRALRLYCPRGNHYHNGRILDIRREERNGHDDDTLCLVRFPAGPDHRKTSLTTWIHLEEHCVAVCTQLVWGHIGSSSSSSSGKRKVARTWIPAKLWSRTARELVPVATLLDESQDQIQFHQGPRRGPIPPVWGLVETFGQDTYELLNLKTEIKETLEKEDMKSNSNSSSNNSGGINGNAANVNMDPLLLTLARAEWHELERVRQWKALPLYNPVHPQALSSRDEYGLGTLEYQDRQLSSTIKLCPSIAQGLDRAYILQQLSSKFGVEASRDVAASLQCALVESVPDGIRALTRRDQTPQT
jgi:hypothetical protein